MQRTPEFESSHDDENETPPLYVDALKNSEYITPPLSTSVNPYILKSTTSHRLPSSNFSKRFSFFQIFIVILALLRFKSAIASQVNKEQGTTGESLRNRDGNTPFFQTGTPTTNVTEDPNPDDPGEGTSGMSHQSGEGVCIFSNTIVDADIQKTRLQTENFFSGNLQAAVENLKFEDADIYNDIYSRSYQDYERQRSESTGATTRKIIQYMYDENKPEIDYKLSKIACINHDKNGERILKQEKKYINKSNKRMKKILNKITKKSERNEKKTLKSLRKHNKKLMKKAFTWDIVLNKFELKRERILKEEEYVRTYAIIKKKSIDLKFKRIRFKLTLDQRNQGMSGREIDPNANQQIEKEEEEERKKLEEKLVSMEIKLRKQKMEFNIKLQKFLELYKNYEEYARKRMELIEAKREYRKQKLDNIYNVAFEKLRIQNEKDSIKGKKRLNNELIEEETKKIMKNDSKLWNRMQKRIRAFIDQYFNDESQ